MITLHLWDMGKVIADGKQEDAVEERLLRVEKMPEKLLAAVRVVIVVLLVLLLIFIIIFAALNCSKRCDRYQEKLHAN